MPSYYYIFQIPYFIHDIESESFFQDRADVPAVGVLLHGLFRFLTQISSLHNDWVASIQLLVKLVTFSPSKTTKRQPRGPTSDWPMMAAPSFPGRDGAGANDSPRI